MLSSIFSYILRFGIEAGWLAAALIILRLILRKAPRGIICAMWALVAVRLILPLDIKSVFSLVPDTSDITRPVSYAASEAVRQAYPNIDSAPLMTESGIQSSNTVASGNAVGAHLHYIASIVWIIGLCLMLIYAIFSYIRLYRLTRESIKTDDHYLCDRISSPFILGIFRPRIILPFDIGEEDKPYVLAHERAHLKRRDHLWKPLGYLLLSVYWFNPLLWIAYILLCRDIELACDEKVIKELGYDCKKPYANALINAAAPKRLITACPVAFGETSVKARVKNILSYKKPAFWIIIIAVILSIVVAVCFLTNPADKSGDAATPDSSVKSVETPNNTNPTEAQLQKLDPIEAVNSFFKVNYAYFSDPSESGEWNWSKAKEIFYGGTYLDGAEQVIMLTNTDNIDSYKPIGMDIRFEKCNYSLEYLKAEIRSINSSLDTMKRKNEGYSESVVEIALIDNENIIEVCIFAMTYEKVKWFKEAFGDKDEIVFRNVTTMPDEDVSGVEVRNLPAVIFTNGETVYISGECGIIFYDIENGEIKSMLSPGYLKELGFENLHAYASPDGEKIYMYNMSEYNDPDDEKRGVFDLTSGTITTQMKDIGTDEDFFGFDSVAKSISTNTLVSVKDGTTYRLSVPGKQIKNMELTVKPENGEERKYKIFE